VILAVALALFSTAALGSLALRRWRRAMLWLAIEWGGYALLVVAIAHMRPTLGWAAVAAVLLAHLAAAADTLVLARASQPRASGVIIAAGWVLIGIAGAAAASLVRRHVVEAFKTPSASMLPSLLPNDHFFVDKRAGKPRRGDVVVFAHPADPGVDYVKRVVAVGGDMIELSADGLVLNGKLVPQRRLDQPCPVEPADTHAPCEIWEETLDGHGYRTMKVSSRDMPPLLHPAERVPEDSMFVVGDNRDNSRDSRHFGPVKLSAVKGRARFVWWSSDALGTRWSRINQPIE
jgi:signal peptidase I